ncbi:MAG: hybrid sensor histidine kinase/response regulator, partial [Mesorhizobium sp.]
ATGSYTCEFRWQCADGNYRIFLDQGVLSNGSDGQKPEILGTLLDITERRELENQLLQSQRIDAIGKLTGGLAHDFNNLLAAILSGLGLLERHAEFDGQAKQVLELTRRSAKQGAELVNRMLAFSRRQTLRPQAVRLAALGDTMNGLVAPVLGGLIRFDWLVDDTVWPIPADILAKVVEPFFTTKPVGKGTGLGLSTVHGFVKQSGGTLRIESTVGSGTVVQLWLPRSIERPVEIAEKSDSDDTVVNAGEDYPSVLLIDDSNVLRELTAQSLRQHGFAVTCAGGGAEALAMIERAPYDFD